MTVTYIPGMVDAGYPHFGVVSLPAIQIKGGERHGRVAVLAGNGAIPKQATFWPTGGEFDEPGSAALSAFEAYAKEAADRHDVVGKMLGVLRGAAWHQIRSNKAFAFGDGPGNCLLMTWESE